MKTKEPRQVERVLNQKPHHRYCLSAFLFPSNYDGLSNYYTLATFSEHHVVLKQVTNKRDKYSLLDFMLCRRRDGVSTQVRFSKSQSWNAAVCPRVRQEFWWDADRLPRGGSTEDRSTPFSPPAAGLPWLRCPSMLLRGCDPSAVTATVPLISIIARPRFVNFSYLLWEKLCHSRPGNSVLIILHHTFPFSW